MHAISHPRLPSIAAPAPVRRPAVPWLTRAVRAVIAQWRADARMKAHVLALEGSSEATLRDIGLADRLPASRPTPDWLQHQRPIA